MRKLLKTSSLAMAMALLSATTWAQDTIKIGLVQPLTGSVAYNGTASVNGSKLAVEQRNKAGGVLGKKIELVIEDGQCSPANSVSATEKLVQKDKVVAIEGAFCSSATAAVMPVAEKDKIPLVTGVSSKADLTEKGMKYFFRASETDALMAKTFAKILVDNLKLKNVAYIGVNDDWGRGSISDFSRDMGALGTKAVLTEYFDHGATDFYTLLAKLRAANPDGVFVAAETQDGSILVKQMREMGLKVKVFGVGSWATPDFINLAGPAAEGIYAAVQYVSGLETPRNQTFVKDYDAAFKGVPGKYSAAGYNSMNILMDAIQRAGNTSPDAIRDALLKTDYAAPNGQFKFTAKGQAYGFSVVLVQVVNKTPKVVATAMVDAP